MKKGTLKNGFEFEFDPSVLDDVELLDDLVEADNGNILVFPRLLTKLIGADQKKALYDALRDKETGRVATEPMTEALIEMIEVIGEEDNAGKN